MRNILSHLLVKSAQQFSERIAICDRNESITYQELDTISDQLAHTLKNLGIKKGDRVGILLQKSIESIIAIFGVLKAGAIYVMLDPSAPVKRTEAVITDCQISALISNQEKCQKLDILKLQFLILVDQFSDQPANPSKIGITKYITWAEMQRSPSHPLMIDITEDDLAYILYTSGSTGKPKGVMIEHRAALNFINWAYECFQVQVTDRVSSHAPLHFDLSIFDIFVTIKAGATISLVPEKLSVFPVNLAKFINEQEITIWYSVPSILIQLVLHGNLEKLNFEHLRHILFAGEVFPIKYLKKLMGLIPHAQYHNLYGPTETNVCTYYPVPNIPSEQAQPLPIGKACANHQVYALNDQGEIAQPSEIGELCVLGSSVMRGYWGQPEKTNAVLVSPPNSFADIAKQAYRTGDLVKQDLEGNYVLIGRRDRLIKSRGYQIDLTEIENLLSGHSLVAEVAVIAIPNEQISHEIKAIVVSSTLENELTPSQLKSFCSAYLPKYAIPHLIEFCQFLPKTSTGKIDRNLLLKQNR